MQSTPQKSDSNAPNQTRGTLALSQSAFGALKKDKRMIKHSALVSRIEKSKSPVKKRRRPSKKLVASLESLADALPKTLANEKPEAVTGDVKIRHRSLKSKPGAMKKKEKLVSMEKDRFTKNMAQMATRRSGDESGATGATDGKANPWAAIRQFIRQTMEQHPADKTPSTSANV